MFKSKSLLTYIVNRPFQMKLFFVLTFIIYGGIISILSYYVSNHYQYLATKSKIIEDQKQTLEIKKHAFEIKMKNFIYGMESLKNSEIFKDYVSSKNKDKNVIDLFSVIMYNNKELSQLRFIDASGSERIRFDRKKIGDSLIYINDQKLQNKASRYYFKDIKNMPNNTIWYSNLDLNIEHGKLEIPIVPTLRIGTPIYSDDKFEGIIIMNIFFKDIIDKFVSSPFFYISIYDKDGNFIHHKHPSSKNIMTDYSWNKYLNINTNLNIHNKSVHKLLEDEETSDYFLSESISDIIPNNENLTVSYEPILSKLREIERNDTSYIITVTLIVLFFSIPLSFIISIFPNKLNDELYETKQLIERQLAVIDEYVCLSIADKNGKIIDVSQAYADLLGYSKEEIIGQSHNIISHPDTDDKVYKDLWNTILSKRIWKSEICNRKKNGKEFYAKIIIKPNLDKNGKVDRFTSYIQDITHEKEIEKISIIDEMTNLYNRRDFNKNFGRYVENAKRHKHPFSMMIIDIDFFKQYNDTYGHQEGDKAIKAVANSIINISTRTTDIGFRLGGEEFGILFSANAVKGAEIFAEKLRADVESLQLEHKNSKINSCLTISIGLFYSEDIQDYNEDDIFKLCDKALYKAKKSGRNQVSLVVV